MGHVHAMIWQPSKEELPLEHCQQIGGVDLGTDQT